VVSASVKRHLVFIMASIEYAGCVRPEIERINYLLQRDGEKATRAWVERTLRIYREAVTKPGSHASNTTYRPLFEKAIHEFEEWLATRG
jgi:hypothetical protein